jgi:hypothetical protein
MRNKGGTENERQGRKKGKQNGIKKGERRTGRQ